MSMPEVWRHRSRLSEGSYSAFSEPLTAEAGAEVYRPKLFHCPKQAFPVMNPQKVVLGMMMALSFGAIVFPKQSEVDTTANAGPPPFRHQNVSVPNAHHGRLLAMERSSSPLGRR